MRIPSFSALLLASVCTLFAARPEPVPVKNEVKFSGTYLTYDEVPEKPTAVSQSEPKYPRAMWRIRVEGQAVVAFVINEKGSPEEVQVASATDAAFGEAAVEAVKTWRFKPGRKDGAPVKVTVRQKLKFHLDEGSR